MDKEKDNLIYSVLNPYNTRKYKRPYYQKITNSFRTIARIGSKAEIHPNSKDEEPRLVFELEYLESLPEYEPISLTRYWFKDTLLGRV